MPLSIREQIAAKRAEALSSPRRAAPSTPRRAAPGGSEQPLEDRTVSGELSRARRSGKLDLSNFSLSSIPSDVYVDLLGIPPSELSHPPPALALAPRPLPYDQIPTTPTKTNTKNRAAQASSSSSSFLNSFDALDLDLDARDEVSRAKAFGTPTPKAKWTEPEELLSFRASENKIRQIDLELGLFGGLKTLDLRGNELSALPDAIADLLQLTWLDVSHNALDRVPPSVVLLPALESLNLSHNIIAEIDLTCSVSPSEEGLAYGTGYLVTSFERARSKPTSFPVLRALNLSSNRIDVAGLSGLAGDGAPLKGLRLLDVGANRIAGVLDAETAGIGSKRLPHLASLVVARNPALEGIDGVLADGVKVDSTGCSWGRATDTEPPTQDTSVSPVESAPVSVSASPSAPTESAGLAFGIPEPTLTLTFITHPAATFDSEPLPIEMDVYLPPASASSASASVPHPVVIWWHGGGLLQGNKENLPPHLRRLPSHAFDNGQHAIVVSPNYRLAPQAPILDTLADVSAAVTFVRTRLADRIAAAGHSATVDPDRIALSGGSAGGYLALIAGLPTPPDVSDAELGGYRGEGAAGAAGMSRSGSASASTGWSPKCIAPFYPITDLVHPFWATKTDPVPWWNGSVPDSAARPHLNPRDAPVATAVSGGPRSILYPYMLQHALFPSLLFLNQRSCGGRGLDGFRPEPRTLSVTHRLKLLAQHGIPRPPVYLAYGTLDDKVQPLDDTVQLLRDTQGGPAIIDILQGVDHAYDEDPTVECHELIAFFAEHLVGA